MLNMEFYLYMYILYTFIQHKSNYFIFAPVSELVISALSETL